jgi:hypothetical protein
MSKQHASFDEADSSDYYEDAFEEEAGFERIRSNTGKTSNIKNDRRQQEKVWGKEIAKYHKQRSKGRNRKP